MICGMACADGRKKSVCPIVNRHNGSIHKVCPWLCRWIFPGKRFSISLFLVTECDFSGAETFCGRQYNQVPLSPIFIVGRREGRFRSMRFSVVAISIRAVADCGEVQLALSERSFSDFWPPRLGEKLFLRQNHVPQHRLRP